MDERILNILLVDDDDVDVMNVRRAFKKANIANPIHVASNGIEALESLRLNRIPDGRRLVLLDINMPKMNGHEAMRAIRAEPRLQQLPVIALSTSDSPKQIALAYSVGVNSFLNKPARFEDFVELMRLFGAYWLHGVRLPPRR